MILKKVEYLRSTSGLYNSFRGTRVSAEISVQNLGLEYERL